MKFKEKKPFYIVILFTSANIKNTVFLEDRSNNYVGKKMNFA